MIDVFLARAGFFDDTAILRLHHDAGLSVRTHPGGLSELRDRNLARDVRGIPPCVAFTSSTEPGQAASVLQALRHLRFRHRSTVFVALLDEVELSGAARTALAVELFETGADEVISTRIDPLEYGARVRALVRRRGWMELGGEVARLEPGQRPRLDLDRRVLIGSEGSESLTAKECMVMRALLESHGVVTRPVIGERLWTDGWCGTKKAIDMHIMNLRRKLRHVCADEWGIETVRGTGFVLVPSEREAASTLSG